MENGERENKMKWRIENRKSFFSLFCICLRFTFYEEEHIFFIDTHVLFQSRWGAKFKERKHLMSRKEVSFEEQIMSNDKYTSIFSGKIEAIVFIFYQIFCNARERMFTNS